MTFSNVEEPLIPRADGWVDPVDPVGPLAPLVEAEMGAMDAVDRRLSFRGGDDTDGIGNGWGCAGGACNRGVDGPAWSCSTPSCPPSRSCPCRLPSTEADRLTSPFTPGTDAFENDIPPFDLFPPNPLQLLLFISLVAFPLPPANPPKPPAMVLGVVVERGEEGSGTVTMGGVFCSGMDSKGAEVSTSSV